MKEGTKIFFEKEYEKMEQTAEKKGKTEESEGQGQKEGSKGVNVVKNQGAKKLLDKPL